MDPINDLFPQIAKDKRNPSILDPDENSWIDS